MIRSALVGKPVAGTVAFPLSVKKLEAQKEIVVRWLLEWWWEVFGNEGARDQDHWPEGPHLFRACLQL